MDIYVLIAALLPAILLGWYIYKKDSKQPEPTGQLIKAALFGVLSCPLSMVLSGPFMLIGLFQDEPTSLADAVRTSFFGAAIPEELAKLFMLWLLLRKNKYFDEKMDGIVYAVFVSLGFAGIENLLYLFGNYEEWVSVGISRALFSVPGHFFFGVLMGYYYSLVKFYPQSTNRNTFMLFLAPILAHGIYDTLCFSMGVSPEVSGILMIVFILFCNRLRKLGVKRIEEHLQRDNSVSDFSEE